MTSAREAGETLVESMISVMFVGLVVTTLVLAIGSATSLSGSHRDLTRADLGLKSSIEAVNAANYASGTLSASTYSAQLPSVSPYVAAVQSVSCIQSQASTSYIAAAAPRCTDLNDVGLQLVTVQVKTTSGEVAETTTIMKRKALP